MKKINQKLAAYVVGIALVVSPFQAEAYSGFGNKQSSTKDEISTGVSLIREHYLTSGGTPRAVQVLDVAYRNPAVDLELYQLSPLGRVQTTPQQAIANTYDGHYVVGAVNASFYNLANGIPVNMLIKQNEIINYGILSNDDGPVNAPFAFGVNRNGALTIADYEPQMSFEINGQTIPLTSVNGQRENGQAVLFTGGHQAATTGASQYATEIVVTNTSKSAKNFAFGDRITGTVSEIRRLGEGANTPIPEDGFVISANGGALAQSLAGVAVGDSITVEAQINDTWKDAEFMMATGPTLVRNGQVSISMNESGSFATSRHPRSAVGISGDGTKLFLVTIDGRQSGYSQGATLRELAEYMRSLGAYQAINLDGGGSTTMVARLPYYEQAITVNRPSESSLRAVPNTLQVISSEPPKRVTEPMLVVDPFENLNNWTASSARAEASISLSGPYDPVRVGSKSLKLTYDYSKGESGIAAAYAKARTAIPLQGRPLELGMWASGDGAEHWLRATVIDGNGQRHTINFTEENQFNWTGWRYVRAQLPADAPQPFKVEQVYTAQGSAEKQGKGAVFFDQLEAIYQSSYQVERFKDVSSSFWARQSILALNDRNVISGYSDGSFRPGEAISREQTAIMIARALNLSAGNHRPAFNDVTSQSFYYDAIAAVDRAGIMSGKSASSFDPKATLTRAEMATILQRAYSITGQSSEPFPDVASTHWAYEAIDALKANGIAQGQPGGGFGPALPTTRAEFSVFLDRVSQ
ncbi:phosphodiester glycosidase family protein [Alkalihalobacillus oceani]|uniref:Phosphodiester glycosidase family protein n=1 Tax=Halalkalibacter oceani TaxID=1653776 RepID=A0A9X2DTK2_9BACI|nr:phosphodiester glycosidase family protein [Halalkalibacter oceani]MCM3716148.1 phosphodiester glycosidase family protein [Halalkalibacter oceani]